MYFWYEQYSSLFLPTMIQEDGKGLDINSYHVCVYAVIFFFLAFCSLLLKNYVFLGKSYLP